MWSFVPSAPTEPLSTPANLIFARNRREKKNLHRHRGQRRQSCLVPRVRNGRKRIEKNRMQMKWARDFCRWIFQFLLDADEAYVASCASMHISLWSQHDWPLPLIWPLDARLVRSLSTARLIGVVFANTYWLGKRKNDGAQVDARESRECYASVRQTIFIFFLRHFIHSINRNYLVHHIWCTQTHAIRALIPSFPFAVGIRPIRFCLSLAASSTFRFYVCRLPRQLAEKINPQAATKGVCVWFLLHFCVGSCVLIFSAVFATMPHVLVHLCTCLNVCEWLCGCTYAYRHRTYCILVWSFFPLGVSHVLLAICMLRACTSACLLGRIPRFLV